MTSASVTVIMEITVSARGRSESAPVEKAETPASAKDTVSAKGA